VGNSEFSAGNANYTSLYVHNGFPYIVPNAEHGKLKLSGAAVNANDEIAARVWRIIPFSEKMLKEWQVIGMNHKDFS
jgi:hypothetical protein